MIVYKDILHRLKAAGYSTYRIRQERHFTESTLTSIRQGRPISTETVNALCQLLHCQPGDILEYRDEPGQLPEPELQITRRKPGSKTTPQNPNDSGA